MSWNLKATRDEAGLRLDVWIERRLGDLSRARVQSLIKAGCVTADSCPAKAHAKVREGMVVTVEVPPPSPAEPLAEPIPLDVLHEDADIIVINKPAGMVVHPAAGHVSGTLVNALLGHCGDLRGVGGELRPGIVHRLDRDTSGALVAAKSDAAHHALARQFKAGEVRKEYLALVLGTPFPASGTIETLIGRSRGDRKKMSVSPRTGRRAVSHYALVETFGEAALLSVRIETGRTHQIRVHLAHLRHPILGDRQYGGRQAAPMAPRQMLHARRLAFRHPLRDTAIECLAPVPPDMQGVIETLRRSRGAVPKS